MSTYVMSDVHGLKCRYDAMLEALALKEEDTLYILGDVIDRGPDGIAILRDVMTREHVVMLLGNHEYMMKQYYEAIHHVITDMHGWSSIAGNAITVEQPWMPLNVCMKYSSVSFWTIWISCHLLSVISG